MKKTFRSDVEFEIGTVLNIERELDNQKLHGTCKVIGAHEPRYLITTLPSVNGRPLFTAIGQRCVVYFLHQGVLFGFRAAILRIVFDPFPMMLVEYPQEIEEMMLRKHHRLECNLSCQVLLCPRNAAKIKKKADDEAGESAPPAPSPSVLPQDEFGPLNASIIDLAEGGCQIVIHRLDPSVHTPETDEARKAIPPQERSKYRMETLDAHFQKDRPGLISFDLPQPSSGHFEKVEYTVRWKRGTERYFTVGLQFHNQTELFRNDLRGLIEHQLKYFSHSYDTALTLDMI